MLNKIAVVFLFVTNTLLLTAQNIVYLDPNAPIESRINDLLGKMTLEEKVGQMTQADNKALTNTEDVKTYYLGSILSGGGSDPSPENTPLDWTNMYDSFQQKALQTRLKIPMIYGIDAVHGHNNVVGTVIFPHNIGLGATRNPDLVENASRITAIEIAATGIDWTFAPCIAVPRDERWGRTYEGFGETPELATLLGAASVRGFQGDSLNAPTSIVACAKHYIGDGGTLGGQDQGNTVITEQELRELHLPGYIAAIENDVKTIMASYNSWNGVKLHGHSYLINDVLKGELGFKGFVVSDWKAIDQIPGDYTSDVEISINAGIDMVMVPNNYQEFFNTLKLLIEQNKISIERIDDAVTRILRVKFELGLFENPMADRSLLPLIGSDTHRDVARQCVRESQVLLKLNDNILPLPKSNIKILVAGEHADNIGLQSGGWTIQWLGARGDITEGTTILEGLKKVAPNVEFIYNANGDFDDEIADYAIVVIGEEPYAEGSGDREELTIDKNQINLVRKVKNLGMPVVTLLISGRPMIINSILHNSDVLFASWLPGTEGDGIAEVIFGDFEPTGKLPMTWQKSMDQIPQNFGDENYDPFFPYGYGITKYENSADGSAPVLNSALLTEDGLHIELSFNKSMKNIGNSEAEFTVTNNNITPIEIVNYELSTLSDNILLLQLGEALDQNANLVISYLSGNISSEDNGNLNPFNNVKVINSKIYGAILHTLPGRIEAEDYYDMFGIQTENTTDYGGGQNVGWIDTGDWIEYDADFQETGTYFSVFRVASQSAGGLFKFLVDGVEKYSRTVPVTNGWQNWETISDFVDFGGGKSKIRISADQGGFNLNWFELSLITSAENNDNLEPNFFLNQNYPNPFNPITNIDYSINKKENIRLSVFDVLGREVKVLIKSIKNPGNYSITFDASKLTSGVYYYQLKSEELILTKKLLLLK